MNRKDKSLEEIEMFITVFTPAYNRGYIIGKLYESLKHQTFKDFEWLVIDDGSTDNTEEIVKGFMAHDNFFPIRYIKTKNGGKHRAINQGVKLAQGILFYTVDSDDHLPVDALEMIKNEYVLVEKKNKIGAFFGLRCRPDGSIIGKTFDGERLLTSSIEAPRRGIRGDKGEVFVTDILKKYPYPEIEGENFSTEAIVWDRISHDGFKFVYFNKWICTCEYLDDGLTHQGWELYARNPIQWSISIGQNYFFGKYTRSEMSPQLFIYYKNVKDCLSLAQMSEFSGLSKFYIISSVYKEKFYNILRRLLNREILK